MLKATLSSLVVVASVGRHSHCEHACGVEAPSPWSSGGSSAPNMDVRVKKPEGGIYNTTSERVTGVINVHLIPHTHDDV